VSDLKGAPLRYNNPDPYIHGILATSGARHDEILDIVRKLRQLAACAESDLEVDPDVLLLAGLAVATLGMILVVLGVIHVDCFCLV
jgi:hypothetical protein